MTAPHEKCNECDLSESCFDCWLIQYCDDYYEAVMYGEVHLIN